MANIIPKIKIGRKSDRNFFNKSHDVNTTSDFGFCQPTILENIPADSKLTLQTSSFVRLAPLPVPTFGRINVKFHTAFVPYRDVFLAYDNFLAQKSVVSGVRHYIPKSADTITNSRLFNFIFNLSYLASKRSDINTVKDGLFFRMALFTRNNVNPTRGQLFIRRDSYYDPLNSVSDLQNFNNYDRQNAFQLYSAYFGGDENTRSVFDQFMIDTFGQQGNYLGSNYATANNGRYDMTMFSNASLQQYYKDAYVPVGAPFGGVDRLCFTGLNDYDLPFFSEDVSLENADFVCKLPNVSNVGLLDNSGSLQYGTFSDTFCAFKLTRLGRRLFKVLTAAGVNFGYKDKPVDVLSLLSYYKVWFDKYNPGRNLQWLDTNCYYLIHSYYDFGYVLNQIYDFDSISVDQFSFGTREYRKRFGQFLCDLSECCYVLPIDNVTVATETPLLEVADNMQSVNELSVHFSNDRPDFSANANVSGNQIYGEFLTTRYTGGLGVKLLNRIYHFMNKNSVLGARVNEFLKAHNLGSDLPESLVLGDTDYSVMVEDQFSSAETAEGYLGEYAGKGKQFNQGDFMKFYTPNSGVLVQFFCIVPYGGYVQGGRKAMVNRFDFYNALYDSLGMQPMTQYEVSSRTFYLNGIQSDSIFGFVPQYFDKKVHNNLANGGFALRSQMGQFLPYSLDRIFSCPDVVLKKFTNGQQVREVVMETKGVDLIADEYLRYIGRSDGFGNYNRIFYDTTGLTDNFIVDIVHEFKQYSPMKPVSESFDTFDDELDNGSNQISHA